AATAAVPSAAPPAAAAELEESSAKVSVKVLAEGADGVNELCFSVRMTTPLGKMMKAWCDHHQVPAGEAAFLLGEQLVKPEDTLLTLGSGTDAVVFRAVPRDHADAKEATPKKRGPKPKSPKPKEKAEKVAKGKGKGKGKSKGKRKGTEEVSGREEESKREAEKPEAKEPSDQQKVSVKVEAEGADGLNELRFNMRLSTPLAKMMQAWCEHHQVPMEDAAFLLGKVALKPE
ncbi:unnamed protein product, partial [Symbiodinium sp. KB8]